MPDPNIALAAIQSHTSALEGALNRHGMSAGRCKVWSGAMVAGMLLLAAGRAQMAALPWAAGVVVLLAVADAGQVAMVRVFTDAYNRFMQKLPLNGENAMNPSTNAQGNRAEEFVLPAPMLGWRQAGRVFAALGSFSVWPFYGALLALVVGFHVQVVARGGDGERGSVGESARLLPSAATRQGSVKSSVPMNVMAAPTPRPAQSANGSLPFANGTAKSAGTSAPPRPIPPMPTFVPSKSSPQQPVIRLPARPPMQPPAAAPFTPAAATPSIAPRAPKPDSPSPIPVVPSPQATPPPSSPAPEG